MNKLTLQQQLKEKDELINKGLKLIKETEGLNDEYSKLLRKVMCVWKRSLDLSFVFALLIFVYGMLLGIWFTRGLSI